MLFGFCWFLFRGLSFTLWRLLTVIIIVSICYGVLLFGLVHGFVHVSYALGSIIIISWLRIHLLLLLLVVLLLVPDIVVPDTLSEIINGPIVNVSAIIPLPCHVLSEVRGVIAYVYDVLFKVLLLLFAFSLVFHDGCLFCSKHFIRVFIIIIIKKINGK